MGRAGPAGRCCRVGSLRAALEPLRTRGGGREKGAESGFQPLWTRGRAQGTSLWPGQTGQRPGPCKPRPRGCAQRRGAGAPFALPRARARAPEAEAERTAGSMSEPGEPERALRRRLPRRLPRRRGDVYVNMKTDFRAQLSRCQKLLAPGGGCAEICIHGLGLAINRAINIALQLEAAGGGALRLAANTSTVELADGAEPEGDADPDADEPLARTRHNSAIHIRVSRADAADAAAAP